MAGRDFTPQDGPGKANVAIVNDAFARHYFGSAQNAIGHMVATGGGKDVKYNIEIVGVVGDTKHSGVRDPVRRTMYRSLLQSSQLDQLAYLVRTGSRRNWRSRRCAARWHSWIPSWPSPTCAR